MSSSIEEALQEAIDELMEKEFVEAVAYHPLTEREESRPCGFVLKLLDVKHLVKNGGSTFSHKSVYIDTETFEYDWQNGGPRLDLDDTPFEDFLKSKLTSIKTSMGFDFIEIHSVDEKNESAIIFAVKGTTGDNADTLTIKVWKKTATTIGYKVISKTSVV